MVLWEVGGHCKALGDFSGPNVSWGSGCFAPAVDRFSRKSIEVVCEHALHQHVYGTMRRQAKLGSSLDLVFSPRASGVSHIDITTPWGIIDHATLSVHWRRDTSVPVRARYTSKRLASSLRKGTNGSF